MTERTIKRTAKGRHTTDGAGVKLMRVLDNTTVKDFDPFLMLDTFDSTLAEDYIAGFPTHPHRGIETVTYLINGKIEHKDSMGNMGIINDGCCQWMTAGSGILHQEMPKQTPSLLGLQLWVNLPAKDKMAHPKYHDIRSEQVPTVKEKNAHIRVLSGVYNGVEGAMKAEYVPITFLDITLTANSSWSTTTISNHTVFAYLFHGELHNNGATLPAHEAILFNDGERLTLQTGESGARVIIVSGSALNEPIQWGGPIVMNTASELQQAFQELEDGTFIKHSAQE